MLVQGLVGQGEGSTVPVESHHTPTSAPPTLQPPSSSPSRRTTRQESMVPQPRSPTQTNVADEAASIGVDIRHGGAATTVTSLDAGQGSEVQGRHEHDMKSDFEFTTAEEVYTVEKGVSTAQQVSTDGANSS
ncbi:hypothetical protein Tco_0131587, partial [Tanacetum coccineum]